MDSPIKWIGGKRREIKYFKQYIPKFKTYVEPFVGGGALFWNLQPEKAVINDINEHLINFYLVLKNNHNELREELQSYNNTLEEYRDVINRLNTKDYNNTIEQAAIFYYLNKTAFSGAWRVNSKGYFNVGYGYYKNENYKNLTEQFTPILKDTIILNQDYKEVINQYKNNSETFIFFDPPYLDCDTLYTPSQKFENIYKYIYFFMKECKCKTMLVVKENEYIIDTFGDFVQASYGKNYKCNAKSEKENSHVVITNYNLQDINSNINIG